jgi:hypothetical protein
MKPFFLALCGMIVPLALACPDCAAEDCPTAVAGRGAFIVERGEQSKTEVTFGDGALVRSVSRFRGGTYLETEQYEGLIQLDRTDRGRKTVFKPRGDLAKLFPLKPKQTISVELDVGEDGAEPSVATVELRMIGTDNIAIGACKYDVLKFERIEARSSQKADPIIEYYAPELKFVVDKEYKERDGQATLIKFDRIYSADR